MDILVVSSGRSYQVSGTLTQGGSAMMTWNLSSSRIDDVVGYSLSEDGIIKGSEIAVYPLPDPFRPFLFFCLWGIVEQFLSSPG